MGKRTGNGEFSGESSTAVAHRAILPPPHVSALGAY
jgi:hypothetical protein